MISINILSSHHQRYFRDRLRNFSVRLYDSEDPDDPYYDSDGGREPQDNELLIDMLSGQFSFYLDVGNTEKVKFSGKMKIKDPSQVNALKGRAPNERIKAEKNVKKQVAYHLGLKKTAGVDLHQPNSARSILNSRHAIARITKYKMLFPFTIDSTRQNSTVNWYTPFVEIFWTYTKKNKYRDIQKAIEGQFSGEERRSVEMKNRFKRYGYYFASIFTRTIPLLIWNIVFFPISYPIFYLRNKKELSYNDTWTVSPLLTFLAIIAIVAAAAIIGFSIASGGWPLVLLAGYHFLASLFTSTAITSQIIAGFLSFEIGITIISFCANIVKGVCSLIDDAIDYFSTTHTDSSNEPNNYKNVNVNTYKQEESQSVEDDDIFAVQQYFEQRNIFEKRKPNRNKESYWIDNNIAMHSEFDDDKYGLESENSSTHIQGALSNPITGSEAKKLNSDDNISSRSEKIPLSLKFSNKSQSNTNRHDDSQQPNRHDDSQQHKEELSIN